MWTLLSFSLGSLIGLIMSRVYENWDDVERVRRVIEEKESSWWRVWWLTVKNIYRFKKEQFNSWINTRYRSTKPLGNSMYAIEYFHKRRRYRIVFKDESVLSPMVQAFDRDGNDVTTTFIEFLGPNLNFHRHTYTAKQLGINQLHLEEKVLSFEEHEIVHHFTPEERGRFEK